MSVIGGLAHINLSAPQDMIERLRLFYRDVIGLDDGPRPAFRSRGYWLYGGERDLVHLTIEPESSAAAEPAATGWFNHVAFALTDFEAARRRLDAARVDYEIDGVPGGGEMQIFLRDPAGIGVELNFRG
jgi:catechol 2,3-dioxygenase-like lactoylglutathione lyase family enzyme